MRALRAVGRGLAILAATGSLLFAVFALRLGRVASSRHGVVEIDRLARRWARRVARSLGFRILVEGEPPEEPVAIVANHLGYLDVVALWCVVPGTFVARADVADWPVVGRASRALGTLFIDRARKRDLLRVLPELGGVLAAGRNAIFFPEATSTAGAEVLPFRSPLFEAVVRRGVPVVGVALNYETPPGSPAASNAVCWWGDMTFVDHFVALLALPQIVVRIRFAEAIPPATDRKALCRDARDAVVKNFVPTSADEGGSRR